ncbi:thioredoxin family protein [bacterium]|nr:thioredoxin family protein [bacterium]
MKVLKFGAVWCPSCLVMRPRWQKIEKELPWLETEYYDYDKDKEMVKKYKVDKGTLPAFIFLDKNGNEILRLNGEPSKEELLKVIEENKDK